MMEMESKHFSNKYHIYPNPRCTGGGGGGWHGWEHKHYDGGGMDGRMQAYEQAAGEASSRGIVARGH